MKHEQPNLVRERAYLAGLFDGEGCVSITFGSKLHHLVGRDMRYFSPRVALVISNNDPALLELMKKILNNYGSTSDKKRSHGHDFRITDTSQVLSAIEVLLENAIIKKNQLIDLRNAVLALQKRERAKWSGTQLRQFHDDYMSDLEKWYKGKRKGRPSTYTLEYIFSSPHEVPKKQ